MPEPGFVYSIVILVPPMLGILFSYLMLEKSYKNAKAIGMGERVEKEKKQLKAIMSIFVFVPLGYALLEWLVFLSSIGVLGAGYDEEKVTTAVAVGAEMAGLGGFFITCGIGFACVRQNQKEYSILSTRPYDKLNADEVVEARSPRMVRKLLIRLVIYQVLAILLLAAVIFLMKMDLEAFLNS